MKVLHIQKLDGIAGSETYLLKILPILKKNNIQVEFLGVVREANSPKNKEFFERLEEQGIYVAEIVSRNDLSLKLLKEISNFINERRPEIVHAHLIHAILWSGIVRKFFGNNYKLLSTWHGYDEMYQAKFGFDSSHKRIDKYWITAKIAEIFTDRTTMISHGLRNLLIELGIANDKKSQVIHYGFKFKEQNFQPNTTGEFRKTNRQLIIVGRLLPVKGHVRVFNIIPKLIEKFPDLSLVLIGNGSHEETLRTKVEELGIQKHVFFEGFQRTVHQYIFNSDIVIVPSSAEGFGVVVLEAFHNKKPVLAFDVPALNEIIENTKSGILIPPFEEGLLAEAISDLLQKKKQRELMGEEGKKRLENDFSIAAMTNKTIKEYKDLVAAK